MGWNYLFEQSVKQVLCIVGGLWFFVWFFKRAGWACIFWGYLILFIAKVETVEFAEAVYIGTPVNLVEDAGDTQVPEVFHECLKCYFWTSLKYFSLDSTKLKPVLGRRSPN